MITTCTRRFQFAYGHRVFGHESKCGFMHGHNGVVRITAEPDSSLDSLGRVVDFSVIKERYGKWIDDNWDHGMILNSADLEAVLAMQSTTGSYGCAAKIFLIENENPTAEILAQYLLDLDLMEGTGVRITEVEFFETENCSAKVVKL